MTNGTQKQALIPSTIQVDTDTDTNTDTGTDTDLCRVGPPFGGGAAESSINNGAGASQLWDPLRRRDARSQPGTPGKGLLCLVSKDPDSPPGQLKGKDVDALSVPGRKRENHVIGIGGSLSAILFAAGHPASLKSWARFARMSMPEAGAFLTTFLLPALRRDPHPVPGAATRIQPGC